MKERIAVNPYIHFGKPCVAGTRVPVLSVLELVSEGFSFETIVRDYYPELQIEGVRACVQYAMEGLCTKRAFCTKKRESAPKVKEASY
jgi:uncharacterized protein (DUF433 family)